MLVIIACLGAVSIPNTADAASRSAESSTATAAVATTTTALHTPSDDVRSDTPQRYGTTVLIAAAASGFAAEGELPELSASRAALEAKFKHAGDFGVTEGRGAAGFDAYGKAIDSFVQDSSTTRILGTYRGDPAILNYNASTAQVVVQDTDGSFISGWQMSPAQLQNVIERGSLGGG